MMPIKNEDTTSILKHLVQFNTVSSRSVLPMADFLAERFKALGFKIDQYPDKLEPNKTNLICTAGPHKEGGLVISGHMDVVPTENQPWNTDPFVLTEKEGKLFGRGSADMKGFIACTLTALSRTKIQNLKEPLCLIWTYDEEVGCQGSFKLADTLLKTKRIFPKEALIGEPTDFKIFRMHPGHVTLKVKTKGKAAHSSKPHLGKNAIKLMLSIIEVINQVEKDLQTKAKHQDYFDHPFVTLNVGLIKGGEAVNIVPDNCEVTVGYRPMPGDDPRAVFVQINDRIANLPHISPEDWQIELINIAPALLTPKEIPLEKTLAEHASHQTPLAASFTTDGGNLTKLGIQSLIFGPGSIDVAHKANEYISVAALNQGSEMVEKVVKSRCEETLAYF